MEGSFPAYSCRSDSSCGAAKIAAFSPTHSSFLFLVILQLQVTIESGAGVDVGGLKRETYLCRDPSLRPSINLEVQTFASPVAVEF